MNRREIEALVAELEIPAGAHNGAFWDGYSDAVRDVATALSSVNPRFEVDRFLKDCGVQS
jgi:hypothetical protein